MFVVQRLNLVPMFYVGTSLRRFASDGPAPIVVNYGRKAPGLRCHAKHGNEGADSIV